MNDWILKLYVKFQALCQDERGQDLIEYALLAALIAVSCITASKDVATSVQGVFGKIVTELDAAIPGA